MTTFYPLSPSDHREAARCEALALQVWLTRHNPVTEVTVLPSDRFLIDAAKVSPGVEPGASFLGLVQNLKDKTAAPMGVVTGVQVEGGGGGDAAAGGVEVGAGGVPSSLQGCIVSSGGGGGGGDQATGDGVSSSSLQACVQMGGDGGGGGNARSGEAGGVVPFSSPSSPPLTAGGVEGELRRRGLTPLLQACIQSSGDLQGEIVVGEVAVSSSLEACVPLLVFQPVDSALLNFRQYFRRACREFFHARGLAKVLVLVPLSNLQDRRRESITALMEEEGEGGRAGVFSVEVCTAFRPEIQPMRLILLEILCHTHFSGEWLSLNFEAAVVRPPPSQSFY